MNLLQNARVTDAEIRSLRTSLNEAQIKTNELTVGNRVQQNTIDTTKDEAKEVRH
jgi:hypothetical protein